MSIRSGSNAVAVAGTVRRFRAQLASLWRTGWQHWLPGAFTWNLHPRLKVLDPRPPTLDPRP
eukprot:1768919-Rhodomonas_salina.2